MSKPEDPSVTLAPKSGWHIAKKSAVALLALFVASCIGVGLAVYFATIAGHQCHSIQEVAREESAQDANPTKSDKAKDIRLPSHLIPEKYKIELIPFIIPGNFTIRGRTAIKMKCMSPGKNVTLHSIDLDVKTDEITLVEEETGKSFKIASHKFDKEKEFYIAKLQEALVPGRTYLITIDYTAILSDTLKGFYRSMYKDQNSASEEYVAITQFEPTDARRAFPCFDEPAFKAKFEVSLGRTKDMSSISNMPVNPNGVGLPMEDNDDYVWDHFEESVPMSTYLVAFVVSKFEHKVSDPLDNNIEFRVWARKDAIDQVEYAKNIGPKVLSFFEKFFGVAYPLPKQDMIAIEDFGAGAMENWGLITYRETAMLYKPGVSALRSKEQIASVVAHELAHQWFGNLVTPSWWTDLWLNEGFASYVEYLGVEAVHPEFKIMEQFVTRDVQSVMGIDALESSHPISVVVKHPAEINEIFDRISYAKGASIIRMMDHFLSSGTFKRGLSRYLKALQFKAASQDDLWHQLTVQAHEENSLPKNVSVKTIMDTWTLQTGFPVVEVVRHYEENSATLKQTRFFVTEKKDDTKWWIPITFVAPGGNFSNTHNSIWMTPNEVTKDISGLPDPTVPVIFNIQETGYYRVNYDEENWKLIIDALVKDHESIHVINRAQILDDALNLARSGKLSYDIALGVTMYLAKETEYVPWTAALDGMRYISKMLMRTAAYGEFRDYSRRLITPLLERVGFQEKPDDMPLDIQLRKLAIGWACGLDIKECIDKAVVEFDEWMTNPTPDDENSNKINVDVKDVVYCTAISKGGQKEWDFGWERYKNSNVGSEKKTILDGLTCSKEIWILNRLLNWTLTEGSGIRKADGRGVIAKIASNNYGMDITFDFIRENWNNIIEFFGSASFSLPGLVKNVLKDRNTNFHLSEIKMFQRENEASLKSAQREVQQAVESAEANIQWMNKNYDTISEWLIKENEQEKIKKGSRN